MRRLRRYCSYAISLVSLHLLAVQLCGQVADTTTYFTYNSSKQFSKDGEIDSIKGVLINDLKLGLAQQISSKVYVVSSQNSTQTSVESTGGKSKGSQNNTQLISQNSYKASVVSSLNIQNPEINTSVERKGKRIWGSIRVNKRSFIDESIGLLNNKISTLTAKMKVGSQPYNDSRSMQRIFNEYSTSTAEINDLMNLISLLDPSRKLSNPEMDADLAFIHERMQELQSKLETSSFQDALRSVQEKKNQHQYVEALHELDLLKIRYPSNAVVEKEISTILDLIEFQYADRILSSDKRVAIEALDELININPYFREKYYSKRVRLVDEYIEERMTKINALLKTNDFAAIQSEIDELEKYGSSNSTRIAVLKAQIRDAQVRYLLNEVDDLIKDKNYTQAHALLKTAKTIAYKESDIAAINRLNQELVNRIAHERIRGFKKTRPNLFQFQAGVSGISVFNELRSTSAMDYNSVLSSFNYSYEAGIYAKSSIRTRIRGKQKDRSRSNLIGLRVALWTPNVIYSKQDTAAAPSAITYTKNIFEPQLSLFTMKLFNLSFGKLIGDYTIQNNPATTKSFYTVSFGIRPHIGNLLFHANVKLLSDFSDNYFIGLNGGASVALNFNRKFSPRERKRMMTEVRNELR